MTSIKVLLPCFAVALLLLSPIIARSGFKMSRFTALQNQKNFKVFDKEHRNIGKGKVVSLSRTQLQVSLTVKQGALNVHATVNIMFKKSDRFSHYLKFQYSDDLMLASSKFNETVKADSYMAEKGILTFFYNKQRNYFQLKRKNSYTQAVFNWGTVYLQ